jgi:opacity protein-like surface antigen
MRKALIILLLLVPAVALAQRPVIEITPFAGYRWGGSIDREDLSISTKDVDLEPSYNYGLALDFPVSEHFGMQLLFDRQRADTDEEELFSQDRKGFDLTTSYYHLGFLWQWTSYEFRPYVVTSLGITHLNPSVPGAKSEQRGSASLGAGFKLDLSEHVAFRLEGRAFWTNTDDDSSWRDCEDDHDDDCWDWEANHDLVQNQVTAGIVIKF